MCSYLHQKSLKLQAAKDKDEVRLQTQLASPRLKAAMMTVSPRTANP
jgi:hypothetical protein